MRSWFRATALALALVGGGSLLGACSSGPTKAPATAANNVSASGGSGASGASGTTSSTGPETPEPGVDAGHVVMPTPGTTTTTPKALPVGQVVLITPTGYYPQQLYALGGKPVVWVNESGKSQILTILGIGVRSKPVPPGAQFVWKGPLGGNYNVTDTSGHLGYVEESTGPCC